MADIKIVKNPGGWIDAAVIPSDQAELMNQWLSNNGRTITRREGERLASDIERCYPGGLDGWASGNGCSISYATGK